MDANEQEQTIDLDTLTKDLDRDDAAEQAKKQAAVAAAVRPQVKQGPDLTKPSPARVPTNGAVMPAPAVLEGEPIPVTDADMDGMDPINDISQNIEYLFYKCELCGKKVFAGGADTAMTSECGNPKCLTGATKSNGFPERGLMRLHKYTKPRFEKKA